MSEVLGNKSVEALQWSGNYAGLIKWSKFKSKK